MTPDEKRAKRVHDITYSTDDRAELAERIVALEELVRYMLDSCCKYHSCDWECKHSYRDRKERCKLRDKASELGLEVPR